MSDSGDIRTPAYVFDLVQLKGTADAIALMCRERECRLLFPLKTCAAADVLRTLAGVTDGFAVSSLFEARMARECLAEGGTVHFTTPGLRAEECGELARLCDYAACNSLGQLKLLAAGGPGSMRLGVRVNPQLPLVGDDRYDPCRRHSKLGIPLDDLEGLLSSCPRAAARISGVHFHSNSESPSLMPLLRTVEHLVAELGRILEQIEWINLGGGYLFEDEDDDDTLDRIVTLLRGRHGLRVFLEPGTAIAADCCTLVASVLDVFRSQGKNIAVLDASVNHCPEVFEYGHRPEVEHDMDDGPYPYILAGSSCLAGDVFGEYRFSEPLEAGTRVSILHCGAYSLVKAHMFNGINLPSVYTVATASEPPLLSRSFSYADYRSRFG